MNPTMQQEMQQETPYEPLVPDLSGLRIGLSGAIPEPEEWGERALDWEILNAVTTLADTVFNGGGHLVHGSHPSFTPRILAQAKPYADERGEPVVTLFMSGLFGEGLLARQLREPRYAGAARLVVVDAVWPADHEGRGAEDDEVRNASLTAMRKRLIEPMDALVVIGGKRHASGAKRPGTLEELKLARERPIPCFLLGGLGGMAAELSQQPEYRDLSAAAPLSASPWMPPDDQDEFLRTTSDYGRAIALIAERLAALGGRG